MYVKKQGSLIHFTIPKTKNGSKKTFVTDEEVSSIIAKYMDLRPKDASTSVTDSSNIIIARIINVLTM